MSIFGRRNAVYLILGELDDVGSRSGSGFIGGGGGGGAWTGRVGGMDAVGHGRREVAGVEVQSEEGDLILMVMKKKEDEEGGRRRRN